MFRRVVALTATSAALIAGLVAAPAAAETVLPTVSDLDASDPGHLSGTVTSPGAPYLIFRFAPGSAPARYVTLTGDSGPFDVETWGYEGELPIWIQACQDAARTQCAEPVEMEQTFIALDVTPQEVTWSDDTTLGPGQQVSVTTVDGGGGRLVATWVGTGTTGSRALTGGTQTLSVSDGTGHYVVKRCFSPTVLDRCVSYPELTSPTYTIKTEFGVTVTIPPTLADAPATTIDIDTTAQGTYDITWQILRNGTALPTPGGTVTGQPLGEQGELSRIEIPAGDLADGVYEFEATITAHESDFGSYTTERTILFRVNRLAPVVSAITLNTRGKYQGYPAIYPNAGSPNHSRYVVINPTTSDTLPALKVAIHNAQGALVRTWMLQTNVPWWGTDQAGKQLPSGVYTISLRDTDGLVSSTTGKVYVESRTRVTKTWTRTVTARSSLVDQYVGRCSTLRKPSARGWTGSLGYYANTKCRRDTWRASAVSTMHGVRVPAADQVIALRVDVYGGAARTRPKSIAGFRLFGTNEKWRAWTVLKPYLGSHLGDKRQGLTYARGLVFPDRWFYWGMATAAGDRYDVKTFKISMTYNVLV